MNGLGGALAGLPKGPGYQACMQAAAAERAQTAEQRRLVLEYPDLAAGLCREPIGYKRPEQWTGYIPPVFDRERPDGTVPPNDSPRRAALLALLEQAAERWDRGERRLVPAPVPPPVPVQQQASELAGANA